LPAGGPAPVRACIDDLLPDILEGRIEPGRVFDRVIGIDEVPVGDRAMSAREAIKVMIHPSVYAARPGACATGAGCRAGWPHWRATNPDPMVGPGPGRRLAA